MLPLAAPVSSESSLSANAITSEQPRLHSTGDDLPEPEKFAVVQVIVYCRKRKTFEEMMARTASKRPRKVPPKLLD